MTTTAPVRRPRKDAAANRAGILRAAATMLASDPSASIDQIARAAGLSRRALYGHFDDRHALLTELIMGGSQRFNAIAASIDDTDAPLALARLTARLWTEAAHVQIAAIVRGGQEVGTLRTDITAPTLARLIEEAARLAVSRIDASSPAATDLAVRAVLSIAGLSWRETEALLATHPDIVADAARSTR